MLCFKRHPDELALPPFCSGFQTFENWQCLGLPHLSLLCDWSIYLSVRVFNICRRLPQTKRHSSLFLHWPGSKFLVVMAACTPSIHVFLGRPLFLLSHGIQSIINFGILSSGILLTWPYRICVYGGRKRNIKIRQRRRNKAVYRLYLFRYKNRPVGR